jgi:hypothetical protein
MFKGASQCMPTVDVLYFDLFNPFCYSPLLLYLPPWSFVFKTYIYMCIKKIWKEGLQVLLRSQHWDKRGSPPTLLFWLCSTICEPRIQTRPKGTQRKVMLQLAPAVTVSFYMCLFHFICVCNVSILNVFGGTVFWTQGIVFARQALYHLSHTSSLFCSGYTCFCPDWPAPQSLYLCFLPYLGWQACTISLSHWLR